MPQLCKLIVNALSKSEYLTVKSAAMLESVQQLWYKMQRWLSYYREIYPAHIEFATSHCFWYKYISFNGQPYARFVIQDVWYTKGKEEAMVRVEKYITYDKLCTIM